MQSTVEEVIKAMQQVAYCFICDVTLPSPINAEQHYASIRHIKKVKAFYSNALERQPKSNSTEVVKKVQTVVKAEVKAPQKERTLCHICNVLYESNLAKQHYQESEHKRKEEAYCDICNILTMSKEQLWQHLHGSKHASKRRDTGLPTVNVQYGPFDSTLPQNLTKVMLVDVCQICNAKFPTAKHALNHYQSQKHKLSVLKVQNGKEAGNFSNTSVSETTNNVVRTNKPTNKPLLKVVDYYCFACKMDVHVGTEGNHRTSFPHTELARLKSGMVSKGIIEEYWARQGKAILCTLCNVKISSVEDATEHFIDAIHNVNFRSWCKTLSPNKIPSESDTKWFYCKSCDRQLDCTTESVRHYQSTIHQKKSELYCIVCDVRNSTKELLEIHCTTALHLENERKNGIALREEVKKRVMNIPTISWRRIDTENQTKSNETNKLAAEAEKTDKHKKADLDYDNYELIVEPYAMLNLENSHSDDVLKEKVLQEVEKLIEALFLSKKVPYEVGLKYLKKCNKEIEVIKKQYEREKCQEKGMQGEVKMDFQEKNGHEKQSKRLNYQELLSEHDYYSFNSDSILPTESETVFNLIDLSEHSEHPPVPKCVPEETQSKVNLTDICDNLDVATSNLESKDEKEVLTAPDKEIENDNNKNTSQNIEESIQKTNDFPPPLEDVTNFKTMAQEITLLKSQLEEKYPDGENLDKNVVTEIERLINLINGNDIPPAVLLVYLQNFNEELNFQDFGKHVTARGVDEVNNGDGDGGKTKAKQEVLFRYSIEDLRALRTAETFTDRLDMQLRMNINRSRINKQCNDLDVD